MDIDMIILILVVFIIGIMIGFTFKKNSEHIVNLDDSRKIELSKCCTDPKCYSKPPHLRDNCQANKDEAKKELDKEFKQMYTQEEYYKKLDDLGITKDNKLTNKNVDEAYLAKMNERLVINPALNDKNNLQLDLDIRKDDRDEIRGYDESVLAPYKK